MAVTSTNFSKMKRSFVGLGVRRITGVFTGPSSYASGGEALSRALIRSLFGMTEIKHFSITPLVKASDGTQYTATFDRNSDTTNQGKIRVSAAGATSGAELAATTDLSGYSSGFSIEGN